MIPRILTLATSAALLALAGCASQQTGADIVDASNQRISGIEARLQAEASSTQGMLGSLGRKVDALTSELRRVQDTVAGQASGAASQKTATSALAARMDKTEQHLSELARQTQVAATQMAEMQTALPALHDQASNIEQRLERLGALNSYQITDSVLAQQADNASLAEQLEAAEIQLEVLAEQISGVQEQVDALQAATPETTEKFANVEQSLAELTTQTRAAIDQAAAAQAALPALNEKAAAAGTRLDTHEGRFAALEKRLEEVARMAQDAYDAMGLGQRKIYGKVIESITLIEDKTLFPINSPNLGEQDKAKLDALATRLKALGTNYHLQIQGHTEGFGSDDYNYELGKARAEVVKNYLKEAGGIPLLRMSVMSYGALESPGYANKSNRRVVVQVLQ